MDKKKILSHYERDTGVTMIWFVHDDGSTITIVDVLKDRVHGWVTKYKGNIKIGFSSKKDAVEDAKEQLRKLM